MSAATALSLIQEGKEALRQADWDTARRLFERAGAEGDTPEALEGLGRACWWLDDVAGVFEVSGIDASEAPIAIARERTPEADFRTGDVRFLPYEDASFDVVTAFNSIQYAAQPPAAAAEAKRVARPGGAIFALVWGREERTELIAVLRALKPFLPAPPPGAPGPFALSYPGALEAVLMSGGLAIKDEGYLQVPFEYRDDTSLVRSNLAPGPAVLAARSAGENTVQAAILEGFAPFRTSSGAYRIETEWRYVLATA